MLENKNIGRDWKAVRKERCRKRYKMGRIQERNNWKESKKKKSAQPNQISRNKTELEHLPYLIKTLNNQKLLKNLSFGLNCFGLDNFWIEILKFCLTRKCLTAMFKDLHANDNELILLWHKNARKLWPYMDNKFFQIWKKTAQAWIWTRARRLNLICFSCIIEEQLFCSVSLLVFVYYYTVKMCWLLSFINRQKLHSNRERFTIVFFMYFLSRGTADIHHYHVKTIADNEWFLLIIYNFPSHITFHLIIYTIGN